MVRLARSRTYLVIKVGLHVVLCITIQVDS